MEINSLTLQEYVLEKKNWLWLSMVVAAALELWQTQVAELGCVIPWWRPLGPLQCHETVEAMKHGLTM